MMEQKLMWCPKCQTMVQSNRKLPPMTLVGLAVIFSGIIDIPILLAFVPLEPLNLGILGFVAISNIVIGVYFIQKGGFYRCGVCNTPTPSAQPPSGPTDFTRMNGQV